MGGGGGGPTGGPGDMFPCDSPWYKDVSALPANAADQSVLSGVQWGTGGVLTVDFSIVYMHANGAPPVPFTLDPGYDPDNDHTPVPVPPGGSLENNPGYQCLDGGDCHLLVVDDSTHRLFELWQANQNADGSWGATQETVWDLTKHYGPDGRGLGCTSADAAGLAILPGLIGVNEAAAGQINHAIRFILPGNHIMHNGYVTPGTHSTGAYSGSLPMGTRLRLRASFDESSLPTAGARAVARAMKKYGMMLADAGQNALTAESDQHETTKWAGLLGSMDLASLKVSDFEVVDLGQVQQPAGGMNCVRSQ
jgi:serine/threonine-protein kinase